MSTLLQGVRKLHILSGAGGAPPTTVDGLHGEPAKLVAFYRMADTLIKLQWTDWKFLEKEFEAACFVGEKKMPAPGDVGTWDNNTFFITPQGSFQEQPVEVVEYSQVKHMTRDGSPGVPYQVVIMSDNSLRLDGTPDGAHVLSATYRIKPKELVLNTDSSEIPEEFHDIIIGRALILYGNQENAVEAKAQGQEIYNELMPRLEGQQIPNANNARYTGNDNHIQVTVQ